MATCVEALRDLHNALEKLNQAYKAANEIEDKDAIFSAMELVQDEVNALAVAGLALSNEKYVAQAKSFRAAKDDLEKFQKKVDERVKFIKLAGQVAEALGKALALLA